jgi:hypothetical protein
VIGIADPEGVNGQMKHPVGIVEGAGYIILPVNPGLSPLGLTKAENGLSLAPASMKLNSLNAFKVSLNNAVGAAGGTPPVMVIDSLLLGAKMIPLLTMPYVRISDLASKVP